MDTIIFGFFSNSTYTLHLNFDIANTGSSVMIDYIFWYFFSMNMSLVFYYYFYLKARNIGCFKITIYKMSTITSAKIHLKRQTLLTFTMTNKVINL